MKSVIAYIRALLKTNGLRTSFNSTQRSMSGSFPKQIKPDAPLLAATVSSGPTF
jgi:hypothetical protein